MICVFKTYFEVGVDQELVEQTPIIAVDGRAEEANEAGEVEEERSWSPRSWGFLDHSLVEGLGASDGLDLCHAMFLVNLVVRILLASTIDKEDGRKRGTACSA